MYTNTCEGYYVNTLLEPGPVWRVQQVVVNSGVIPGIEVK